MSLQSQQEIIEGNLFFRHYTKIYIPFEDFVKIPAFANAQKIRQKLQNKEGKIFTYRARCKAEKRH